MHVPKPLLALTLALGLLTAPLAQSSPCLSEPPAGFPSASIAWHSGWQPAASTAAQATRIALGKALFADPRLSGNGSQSCASCHQQAAHLAEHRPRAVGSTGQALAANTPTLYNSALKFRLEWQANGPERLFEQHRRPLTGADPIEMGLGPPQLAELNQDTGLRQQLIDAQLPKGTTTDSQLEFTLNIVTRLIAGYVTTLRCATAFDRLLYEDDQQAMSAAARRGLALFSSERLQCASCHRGPLLGGGLRGPQAAVAAVVHRRQRAGKLVPLATPSLRGVAHTAPYYFDGSAATLGTVLDDYARGQIHDIEGFTLRGTERADLLAFLETL